LYAGHKSPKQLLAPGTCRERGAFWWSGLLALYTGLRAGEIAQVLTSDFDFEKPVPVIHVRPEDQAGHRAKRVKTAASVREVPIAPTLIALGLREFVESRRERSGARRLLREINLGQKDRTSDGMSKFWGRALRAAKVHKPGRSVHVFRHTVTAAMRSAGVSNDVIGAFLGHQPTTVTGQYGGRYPPNLLAEAASAIDFGFDVIEALGGIYVHKLHGSGPATAKY
jgi:integrase